VTRVARCSISLVKHRLSTSAAVAETERHILAKLEAAIRWLGEGPGGLSWLTPRRDGY